MSKSLMKMLKFAIEHWLGMLLTVAGTAIGGKLLWLYRTHLKEWLFSEYSLEMVGWMWVALVLIVGILPISVFWFCKKTKRRVLYREDGEILVVLEDKLRELEKERKNQIRIDFRIWDKKLSLMTGKAQKLLPQVVQKDKTWEIKNRCGNAMTIIRKDPRRKAMKRALEGFQQEMDSRFRGNDIEE